MSISSEQLQQIALMAYLDPNDVHHLLPECNSTLQQIQTLQGLDVSQFQPLSHPLDISQHLRPDISAEGSSLTQLAQSAPVFENSVYLVPQILQHQD